MRDIPKLFWPFISTLINVFDYGNCGYRVVANFLYQDEKWFIAKQQLMAELELNKDHYIDVFGCVERYNELYYSLPCTESPAPLSYWINHA